MAAFLSGLGHALASVRNVRVEGKLKETNDRLDQIQQFVFTVIPQVATRHGVQNGGGRPITAKEMSTLQSHRAYLTDQLRYFKRKQEDIRGLSNEEKQKLSTKIKETMDKIKDTQKLFQGCKTMLTIKMNVGERDVIVTYSEESDADENTILSQLSKLEFDMTSCLAVLEGIQKEIGESDDKAEIDQELQKAQQMVKALESQEQAQLKKEAPLRQVEGEIEQTLASANLLSAQREDNLRHKAELVQEFEKITREIAQIEADKALAIANLQQNVDDAAAEELAAYAQKRAIEEKRNDKASKVGNAFKSAIGMEKSIEDQLTAVNLRIKMATDHSASLEQQRQDIPSRFEVPHATVQRKLELVGSLAQIDVTNFELSNQIQALEAQVEALRAQAIRLSNELLGDEGKE